MDFTLTEEQQLLRSAARDFLSQEWPVSEMRRCLDGEGKQAADELWPKIVELGWPALLIDEEYDGLGQGVFDLVVLMEEMGRKVIPGTFFSSGVAAALALQRMGSDDAKSTYLPKIAEGEIRATLAVADHPKRWKYVPDATGADLVVAVVPGGSGVELRLITDVEAEELAGLDPTRSLGQVEPAGGDLGGGGSAADLEAVLDIMSIGLSAEMVGGSAEMVDQAVAYVKQRKQFGVVVGSFQAVQHRAANMLIHVEKSRSGAYYAGLVADESPERLAVAASLAKVSANQAYNYCSKGAIQLHGGIGFTWEQDLHLYFKRSKSCELLLGDDAWHLDRLSESLGD